MHARFGRSGTYVLSDRDVVLSMLWFVACATGWLGPVANLGHAGGLVAGLLCGLPPYLRHLRDRRSSLATVEHSWAQTQGTGWQRFRRRVLMPYMPVWFLAMAAVVIAVELS
jgi:GlpG protein